MLDRLIEPFRRFGTIAGALYLLDRGARRAGLPLGFSHHLLVAQPVQTSPRLPAKRGQSIATRALAPGDPALTALDAPPSVAAFRFGQGAYCLGAFKGDEPIGALWLAFDRFDEDIFRLRFELEPRGRCAWDLGLHVVPAHRGSLAFARLWDAADALMRARGVAWTLSRVASVNTLSNASHARLGAVTIGTLAVIRVGRAQVYVTSRPWRLRLSSRRGALVTLTLRAPGEHGIGGA